MFSKEVPIPEGIEIEINKKIKVTGPKGSIEKSFKFPREIKIKKEENRVVVFSESERRKIKAIVGSLAAHIRNMIKGVRKGFTYKLRICYLHFPPTVKVEGNKVLIQNFLGEKKPRIAEIIGNSKVEVKGSDVIVTGIDIDEVSQTAANIENACRITGYDRRRFLDGIYIYSKEEG